MKIHGINTMNSTTKFNRHMVDKIQGAAMVRLRPENEVIPSIHNLLGYKLPTMNTAVAKLSINKLYAARYINTPYIESRLMHDFRFNGYELVIEKWAGKIVIGISDLEATQLAQAGIPMKNRII
jgi:hypothetical protein